MTTPRSPPRSALARAHTSSVRSPSRAGSVRRVESKTKVLENDDIFIAASKRRLDLEKDLEKVLTQHMDPKLSFSAFPNKEKYVLENRNNIMTDIRKFLDLERGLSEHSIATVDMQESREAADYLKEEIGEEILSYLLGYNASALPISEYQRKLRPFLLDEDFFMTSEANPLVWEAKTYWTDVLKKKIPFPHIREFVEQNKSLQKAVEDDWIVAQDRVVTKETAKMLKDRVTDFLGWLKDKSASS